MVNIKIKARAPTRIEFGGGGTDIEPYASEHGGLVLNAAINKYVYATLNPTHSKDVNIFASDYKRSVLFEDLNKMSPDPDVALMKAVVEEMNVRYGVDISVRSDLPPDTGLGSGATVLVAAIGLLNHLRHDKALEKHEIAQLAVDIEKKIGRKGGIQAHYAATFGGINKIMIKDGVVRPIRLELRKNTLLELEKNLVLVYTGRREPNSVQNILTLQQRSYREKDKRELLDKLKEVCNEMCYALKRGDTDHFGELLGKAWSYKRMLNPKMTNEKLEAIYNLARGAGALGGRIIGAGGGGHMLFYCESGKEQIVTNKLLEKGLKVIDFSFEFDGLQTWEAD